MIGPKVRPASAAPPPGLRRSTRSPAPRAADYLDEILENELAPEAAPPPLHWPAPLELPDEVASRSRAELPEAFVCPLTMGLMRQPAITPRGTTYEYEAAVSWINSHGRYPAGEAGALARDDLIPNLALRNLIEAWLRDQTAPAPAAPAAPPAAAPARPSRSPARRRR